MRFNRVIVVFIILTSMFFVNLSIVLADDVDSTFYKIVFCAPNDASCATPIVYQVIPYTLPGSTVTTSDLTIPYVCSYEGTYWGSLESQTNGGAWSGPTAGYAANAYTINWDGDATACTCKTGNSNLWNANADAVGIGAARGQCCGDDIPGDAGTLTPATNDLCTTNTAGAWGWFHANQAEMIGDIFHVPNGGFDAASDGSIWFACAYPGQAPMFLAPYTGSYGKLIGWGTVFNLGTPSHGYICYNSGASSLIPSLGECISNYGTSYNGNYPTYGAVFTTGQKVEIPGQLPEFCSSSGGWINDLDLDRGACIGAGYQWTGTQCCGDDIGESYNEDYSGLFQPPGSDTLRGGCFKRNKIINDKLVSDKNIIKNGDFTDGASGKPSNWDNAPQGSWDPSSPILLLNSGGTSPSQSLTGLMEKNNAYLLSADFGGVGGQITITITGIGTYTLSGISGHNSVPFTTPDFGPTTPITITIIPNPGGNALFDNIQLNFSRKIIINFNGIFYGCRLGAENIYTDTHVTPNVALIPSPNNLPFCNITGSYFCKPTSISPATGRWSQDLEGAPSVASKTLFKQVPTGANYSGIEYSCCPSDYCWNGTWCVQSQEGQPDLATTLKPNVPSDDLFLCRSGSWVRVPKVYTWDRTQFGFCFTNTQCLVSLTGNSSNNDKPETYLIPDDINNPQCINTSQFIGDHLCENTNWSSRTKNVALQLLDYAKSLTPYSYVLYCDHYTKTLGSYNYTGVEGYLRGEELNEALSFFTGEARYTCQGSYFECVNNFCVLKYIQTKNDPIKVIFGTSLNKPVNDATYSFLKALKKFQTYCNDVTTSDNNFHVCSSDNSFFYSKGLNSMIYSREPIPTAQPQQITTPPAANDFSDFIRNPIRSIIDYITSLTLKAPPLSPIGGTVLDYEFTKRIKDFNTLYIERTGSKAIQAAFETSAQGAPPGEVNQITFMAINYSGFSQNICASVDKYSDTKYSLGPVLGTKIGDTNCSCVGACGASGTSYYIISSQDNVISDWRDFISKLRIS